MSKKSSRKLKAALNDGWAKQGSDCGCHAINIAQPVVFCSKHAAVDAIKEENERLKAHIRDLDHDLNGTIAECNEHCGREQ